MSLSFGGDFTTLKEKLSPLGGLWDLEDSERKIMRLDGGVLNWYETTGKISIQGKEKGKALLEEKVPKLLLKVPVESALKGRIVKLIEAISADMFEREEIIAVALLGALCGQNTFLYGPPGTAKSLISRRIACAFSQPAYFEYLMNRFSTPEDVFGPVSIKELKEDKYVRKTDRYLPKAEFAFLDEIWKSSPAILNTLLTLINERIYRNGETIEKAPLKALIAASNETPERNQGLDALYDRFIVRLMVGPISEVQNFENLLNSAPTSSEVAIDESLKVTSNEWEEWRKGIDEVKLSAETLTIIHLIRDEFAERNDELGIYVSDRRWQRAAILLKASAFFNDRKSTNHSDALLLEHCLWTQSENLDVVTDIVRKSIQKMGFESDVNLAELDCEKERLELEIREELFFSENVYETCQLDDEEFFRCREMLQDVNGGRVSVDFYIDTDYLKTTEPFNPCDEYGNDLEDYTCEFDGQGTCKISYDRRRYPCHGEFTPRVLVHKGDRKPNVNSRLVLSLGESVKEIRSKLSDTLERAVRREKGYLLELQSPFVPSSKVRNAILAVSSHIERLKLRIKDCERLEELCN